MLANGYSHGCEERCNGLIYVRLIFSFPLFFIPNGSTQTPPKSLTSHLFHYGNVPAR